MTHHTLHFTFGPVQGFVAQARRTRDLWAGSYLLAYLAGVGMKAVQDNGGSILFPHTAKDDLLAALKAPAGAPLAATSLADQAGSLPNRFKASLPAGLDGHLCANAIQAAWLRIANEVRGQWLPAPFGTDCQDLWCQQIQHHWDYAWCIGQDNTLLDQRKNLRSHLPPAAEGEKCTVCGERQELSGKGMGSNASRRAMRDWWQALRERARISHLNLRDGERLCAVCFTKRMFPHQAPAAALRAIGWQVPTGFPSTAYMAASDWVHRVLDLLAQPEDARPNLAPAFCQFVAAAETGGVGRSEAKTRIKRIEDAISKITNPSIRPKAECFADLDGGVFFDSTLANVKEFPLNDDQQTPAGQDNPKRTRLRNALNTLQQALPEKDGLPRQATPFYALLLMDGDNMGSLLGNKPDHEQEQISAALAAFTQAVPGIVTKHHGRLIYAGGDDVFALLPLDTALACAAQCRAAYAQAFKDEACFVPAHQATLSGAIEYAHVQTALGVVVRDAHRLLDDIAKARTGRDAIACRVWKRGGPVLTWAKPWEAPEATGSAAALVYDVKTQFTAGASFSSKFFHKLGDLFEVLALQDIPPSEWNTRLTQTQQILAVEYLANRERPDSNTPLEKQRQDAEHTVGRLLALCTQTRRQLDMGSHQPPQYFHPGLAPDGALLVRFLAQKEV